MQSLTGALTGVSPPFLFATLSMALLLAPGPTNTLLLVSGALDGRRASFRLVAAELLGYLIAINILAFSIGPFVQAHGVAQIGLRIGVALYLLWLALKLWAAETSPHPRRITPRNVFVTTLLNPKAAIFAFILLPPMTGGHWLSALPYLIELSALIIVISLGWISLGAILGSGRIVRISPRVFRSLASAALIIFAVLISIRPAFAVH